MGMRRTMMKMISVRFLGGLIMEIEYWGRGWWGFTRTRPKCIFPLFQIGKVIHSVA